MQWFTKNHNESQRTTTTHNEPQWATMMHNDPQRPTTSHSEPQRARTNHSDTQLRHKMNKTHIKLHSLVYTLSPLNPLVARILIKIVLMLVPQVRITCRRVLAPGIHTIFRHYFVCGGRIWKRFCVRNIKDLAVKGQKSKYKFAAKFFLCVYFFLFFTWNYRQKTKTKLFIELGNFFKVLLLFGTNHSSLGVYLARIVFMIFVNFKFPKISPLKSFFTDIARLHVWLAVYWNSNSNCYSHFSDIKVESKLFVNF